MSYKWGKIIFDILIGKLKIKNIKKAIKIYDILIKISKKKLVSYKDFSYLKIRDIKMSIELYNKYNTGKDINIEYILNIIKDKSDEILKYYSSHGQVLAARNSPFSIYHPAELTIIRSILLSLIKFKK